jgi:O-antigen/teichoic acid export membrane protein
LTLISAQIISNPNENQEKALSNLFSLRLFTALILLGLAPITVLFFPYDQVIKLGVLISTLIFLFPALNQILIALFQKKLEMEKVMLSEVISKTFLVIFIFIFAKINQGLTGMLWASVLSGIIGFIILWLYSQKSVKIKLEFDLIFWKKIIKRTWPLALTIILNLIYLKGDILILSLFKSNEEVGIYGASYRAIEVIGTIPYMFAGIMLPIFTANWLKGENKFLEKIIQKSFDFMIILALPLAVGTQFIATKIMMMIAGQDFGSGGPALQILIISTAMLFVSCIFSHIIIAINKQKKVIGLYAITAALSLVLYLFLIPRFSYIGAAMVTIFSNALILLGTYYYVKKFTSFQAKFVVLKKSILSSLGMALFMFLVPKSLYANNIFILLIILLAGLIYFSLLYMLKGISKEDIKTFMPKKI